MKSIMECNTSPLELTYNLGDSEALISCGSYGCVYDKVFKCEDCDYKPTGHEVTKIGAFNELHEELRLVERLMSLAPEADFYVAPLLFCIPATNDFNINDDLVYTLTDLEDNIDLNNDEATIALGQLVYPYAGKVLSSKLVNNEKSMKRLIIAIYNLFLGVEIMNENNFYHTDIKEDNILVNPETFEARFIDFGLAQYVHNYSHLSFSIEFVQFISPPFSVLLLPNLNVNKIQSTLEYTNKQELISRYIELYKRYNTDLNFLHWLALQRLDLYDLTISILNLFRKLMKLPYGSKELLAELISALELIKQGCLYLDENMTTKVACDKYFHILQQYELI